MSDTLEQARSLRQEVGDNVRGVQSAMLDDFKSLGDQQSNQIRAFGSELRAGFGGSDKRTASIAQRVAEDLQ